MTAGFGNMSGKNNEYAEYLGSYVVLYPTHHNSFAGKVKEVTDEWVVLQPFAGADGDAEKGLVRRLVSDKPAKIRRTDIVAIEPTTDASLVAYCEYQNKHPKKDKQDKQEPKTD